MKTIYISVLTALSMLGISSCSSDETAYTHQGENIEIDVKLGSATRTNPQASDASANQFVQNDDIKLIKYDDAQHSDSTCYRYDGAKWNTYGKNMLWTSNNLTFKAVHPVSAYYDYYLLPVNQSTAESLVDADYMTCSVTEGFVMGAPLNLEMTRRTSRIIINPVFNGEYQGITPVVTDITVAAGHAVGTLPVAEKMARITPFDNNGKYVAIVGNTTQNTSENFIQFKLSCQGDVREFVIKGIPAIEIGKSYVYNLSVGKEKAEISGVTIHSWRDKDIQDEIGMKEFPTLDFVNHTITMIEPGTLSSNQIMKVAGETRKITIKGPINITDLKCISQVADNEVPKYPVRKFDLSEAEIIDSSGVYEIPEGFFYGSTIEEISLPKNTKVIGVRAFCKSNLEIVNFNEGLEKISQEAFAKTCLNRVVLPKTVTCIEDYCFGKSYNIESIVIPFGMRLEPTVTEMSECFFINIGNLRTVKIYTTKDNISSSKYTSWFSSSNTKNADLTLHESFKPDVTTPNVWAEAEWKSITFVNDAGETVNL